ncbi:MAG: RcnB family protein [Rhodospirillaceae bacterium]
MKTLVAASLVLAFLAGSPAFAQREHRDSGRSAHDARESGERGDQPGLSLKKGDTVPYEYRVGGHHIHYTWRESGLRRPPEGYAWMLIGDDYLLADQRSGLIREVRKAHEQRASLSEGGKVPYAYMEGGHYINYQWRESGLRPPPKGYAWMRIGDQFVLADQHSGLIKDIRSVDNPRRNYRSRFDGRRP